MGGQSVFLLFRSVHPHVPRPRASPFRPSMAFAAIPTAAWVLSFQHEGREEQSSFLKFLPRHAAVMCADPHAFCRMSGCITASEPNNISHPRRLAAAILVVRYAPFGVGSIGAVGLVPDLPRLESQIRPKSSPPNFYGTIHQPKALAAQDMLPGMSAHLSLGSGK